MNQKWNFDHFAYIPVLFLFLNLLFITASRKTGKALEVFLRLEILNGEKEMSFFFRIKETVVYIMKAELGKRWVRLHMRRESLRWCSGSHRM